MNTPPKQMIQKIECAKNFFDNEGRIEFFYGHFHDATDE